jgi:hypothetical protein
MVMCLMKLHNYCIDTFGRKTCAALEDDEAFIQYRAWTNHATAVTLNRHRVPAEALLGSGHHRRDWVRRNHHAIIVDERTPMRRMMQSVVDQGLARPPVH